MNNIIFLVIGLTIGAGLTYLILRRRPQPDAVWEAKLEATRERTRREAHDEFLDQLQPEIEYHTRMYGRFFYKKTEVVVRERLLYRHLPITGWVEQTRVIQDEMDNEKLEGFIQAVSVLLQAVAIVGRIKSPVLKRIPPVAKK